jgi:uncharacterized membrane protein YbhN (UPF0104 family)
VSANPPRTVVYLEPEIEAEPLPDEFSPSNFRRSLAILGAVALVVVALIVLVPGLASLRDRFAGAQPGWLVLAVVLQLGSCAGYVLVFRGVFCRRMSWRTSSEIGLSELAANSVLPVGGAGGLALGAWILRRGGLENAFIARRTVAFFLLTSLANVTFLAVGGLGIATGLLGRSSGVLMGIVPAVIAVAAVALALAAHRLASALAGRSMRARVVTAAEAVAAGVDEALELLRARDSKILVGAASYLLFDVAMLGVCFKAFGNDVPAVGVLLVAYLVGQLGSLIPIPGGLGGVDAGLIGSLVLYGVAPADAAVAVIAYRGLLLSVPAIIGLPALAVLRRRLRDEAHDIAACAPGEAVEVLGRGPGPREPVEARAAEVAARAKRASARRRASRPSPARAPAPRGSSRRSAWPRPCRSPSSTSSRTSAACRRSWRTC